MAPENSTTRTRKPDLGPYVRNRLTARYGSMAVAADKLEISYERLKKAVQRSSFSTQDLEILLPGRGVEDLKREYDFNFSRRGDAGAVPPPVEFDLYRTIEPGFRSFQRGVRDMDFTRFVDDLYDNIGAPPLAVQAMTLFCDSTSLPLEWSSDQAHLTKQLAHALNQGAIVLYVLETDLINTVRSDNIEFDNLDRQFDRYLDRLDRLRDVDADGFLALIRVRRCSFCTPFQKPALFSRISGEEVRHFAATTVNVPEISDGDGHLGTALLPQQEEAAHAMRNYLLDLVVDLRKTEPLKSDFHFIGSHGRGQRSDLEMLLQKLETITGDQ